MSILLRTAALCLAVLVAVVIGMACGEMLCDTCAHGFCVGSDRASGVRRWVADFVSRGASATLPALHVATVSSAVVVLCGASVTLGATAAGARDLSPLRI